MECGVVESMECGKVEGWSGGMSGDIYTRVQRDHYD